jgi:hypothetical protein
MVEVCRVRNRLSEGRPHRPAGGEGRIEPGPSQWERGSRERRLDRPQLDLRFSRRWRFILRYFLDILYSGRLLPTFRAKSATSIFRVDLSHLGSSMLCRTFLKKTNRRWQEGSRSMTGTRKRKRGPGVVSGKGSSLLPRKRGQYIPPKRWPLQVSMMTYIWAYYSNWTVWGLLSASIFVAVSGHFWPQRHTRIFLHLSLYIPCNIPIATYF